MLKVNNSRHTVCTEHQNKTQDLQVHFLEEESHCFAPPRRAWSTARSGQAPDAARSGKTKMWYNKSRIARISSPPVLMNHDDRGHVDNQDDENVYMSQRELLSIPSAGHNAHFKQSRNSLA